MTTNGTAAGEQMNYAGVSRYRDRHGKTRWRYRDGKGFSCSLPEPGSASFDEAYAHARVGVRSPTAAMSARRSALVEHYAMPALRRARARATRRGLPFELTKADYRRLLDQQRWRCAVSGIEFDLFRLDDDAKLRAFRPSIDRITPSLGYVPSNCRVVLEIVNLAMKDWGEDPLRLLVARMAERLSPNDGEP